MTDMLAAERWKHIGLTVYGDAKLYEYLLLAELMVRVGLSNFDRDRTWF
jgi:hypothetical protein